jgi:hypothetical protein
MAAGLGFKTFATGDVLTAGDTNGYLMQGVLVFADAAARDAAITSPQEGQFAFLKDTNQTMYYTGSAWTNLDTTGMTNPMTTTGDTIYSSSGSTPARLGIGSTGQVLTVASGLPSWATPSSSGAFTLISSTSVSGANSYSVNSVFSSSYTNYKIHIKCSAVTNASDDMAMKLRASGTDSSVGLYSNRVFGYAPGVGGGEQTNNASNWFLGLLGSGNPAVPTYNLDVFSPEAATKTSMTGHQLGVNASYFVENLISGYANNDTQYDGFTIFATGNFSATIKVYGYGN